MRPLVEELEPRICLARPYGPPYPQQDLFPGSVWVELTANGGYDQVNVRIRRNADPAATPDHSGPVNLQLWTTKSGTKTVLQTTNNVSNGTQTLTSYSDATFLQNADKVVGVDAYSVADQWASWSWNFPTYRAGDIFAGSGQLATNVATIPGDNTNVKVWSQATYIDFTATAGTMTFSALNGQNNQWVQESQTNELANNIGLEWDLKTIPRSYQYQKQAGGAWYFSFGWTLTVGNTSSTFTTEVISPVPPGGGAINTPIGQEPQLKPHPNGTSVDPLVMAFLTQQPSSWGRFATAEQTPQGVRPAEAIALSNSVLRDTAPAVSGSGSDILSLSGRPEASALSQANLFRSIDLAFASLWQVEEQI